MYSPLQMGTRYLKYYIQASNGRGHGMHSPFVYEFITEVLNDDRNFYAYESIEQLRQQLLSNDKEITITGSAAKQTNIRRVSDIARLYLQNKKFSQLLFRIADHYSLATVLELGTSLGITTAYLAAAKPESRVMTIEAADAVASLAKQHFGFLQLDNIEQIGGSFSDTLPAVIERTGNIDLIYISGNHADTSISRYFTQILPAIHPGSMLIFDNIHSSREAERAWKEILEHPSITLSIDLFFMSIVLFRKENKAKQHFTIRF